MLAFIHSLIKILPCDNVDLALINQVIIVCSLIKTYSHIFFWYWSEENYLYLQFFIIIFCSNQFNDLEN